MKSLRTRVALPILVIALFFGVWEAHCLYFARLHLMRGSAAYSRGELETARLEWESAASRPAPLNVYAKEGMENLVRWERDLEAGGRIPEALRLCFSVEGIVHATSGYWSYYMDEGEYVRERIPKLAARMGLELSPDRFTLYRPVRHTAAHAAILCFAGFLAAAAGALTTPGVRKIRLSAVAAALFIAWIFFLGVS